MVGHTSNNSNGRTNNTAIFVQSGWPRATGTCAAPVGHSCAFKSSLGAVVAWRMGHIQGAVAASPATPATQKQTRSHDSHPSYHVNCWSAWQALKMTWPLVILGLQLGSSETFVLDSVVNTLLSQYHLDQGNVIDQILQMKTNTVMTSPEKVSACIQFIKQGLDRGMLPNMAVAIDTHADHFSGYLRYGGSATAPKAANIGELIEPFATKEILELMNQAPHMGRSQKTNTWNMGGPKELRMIVGSNGLAKVGLLLCRINDKDQNGTLILAGYTYRTKLVITS
ncbi:hypothetical protein JOM56_009569 [Amanita muscaria]